MKFDYPDGASPLDSDEEEALWLTHITSRDELNRWEQDNINEAIEWISRYKQKDVLSEDFIRRLHKKMFGNVWKWAGQFRQSEKSIGVPPWWNIAVELRKLCDDTKTWIERETYAQDEIAARFHHRLTRIHPFPNGNGRHARLMADIVLEQILKQPWFTWGRHDLIKAGECRSRYIEALRAADRGDYALLLEFVRS